MPGFSEKPQPNNSGEKSEKPKKAERETNTAGEVPEGVREGDYIPKARDVEYRHMDELDPKESCRSLDEEFKNNWNKSMDLVADFYQSVIQADVDQEKYEVEKRRLLKKLKKYNYAGSEVADIVKSILPSSISDWSDVDHETKDFFKSSQFKMTHFDDGQYFREAMEQTPRNLSYLINDKVEYIVPIPGGGVPLAIKIQSAIKTIKDRVGGDKQDKVVVPKIISANFAKDGKTILVRGKNVLDDVNTYLRKAFEANINLDNLIDQVPNEFINQLLEKEGFENNSEKQKMREKYRKFFTRYCFYIKNFVEKLKKMNVKPGEKLQLIDDVQESGGTEEFARNVIEMALQYYKSIDKKDSSPQLLDRLITDSRALQTGGSFSDEYFNRPIGKTTDIHEKGPPTVNKGIARYKQSKLEYWGRRRAIENQKTLGEAYGKKWLKFNSL